MKTISGNCGIECPARRPRQEIIAGVERNHYNNWRCTKLDFRSIDFNNKGEGTRPINEKDVVILLVNVVGG